MVQVSNLLDMNPNEKNTVIIFDNINKKLYIHIILMHYYLN